MHLVKSFWRAPSFSFWKIAWLVSQEEIAWARWAEAEWIIESWRWAGGYGILCAPQSYLNQGQGMAARRGRAGREGAS
uniref:Reverse transcriptase zinc-binding domain-containing protein n=1 Tax=Setaria digitata TaxID=48799 RepID=A0A915PX82_9BILA